MCIRDSPKPHVTVLFKRKLLRIYNFMLLLSRDTTSKTIFESQKP
jgi:hypothetical protein